MGQLRDKLTGTKYPESTVVPLPATEVRAVLLALDGSDVPFVVRNGTPKERADLVAECRIPELFLALKTRIQHQRQLELEGAAGSGVSADQKSERTLGRGISTPS